MKHKRLLTVLLMPALMIGLFTTINAQEGTIPEINAQPSVNNFNNPLEVVPNSEEDQVDVSEYGDAKITESGSLYLVGEEEVINKNIGNDVVFAGGELVINGDIVDNVIFVGGAVEINGVVNGDILFAGGVLILNGEVNGDIRAFGGSLFINSEIVNGDVLMTGGQIGISSITNVVGDVDVNAMNTDLNATNNPTTLSAAESMDLPFNNSSVEAALTGFAAGLSAFAIIISFLMLLGTVFMGYVFIKLFPVFTEKTLETMKKSPGESIGYGCVTMVVGFFLFFFLLFSVIGIKLLFLLIVLAVLAWIIGGVYAKYMIGRMLLERFGKVNTGRFIVLLVGTLIVDISLFIFGFIPILTIFTGTISFFLDMWGMGAIVLNKYRALRGNKVQV